MPTTIVDTSSSLWTGVRNAFGSFMEYIPSLIGGIVLLVVGWFIAKLIASLVERALHLARFERVADHSGLARYLSEMTPPLRASQIVAALVKWFIFLIFIQAVANALRVPQVGVIINNILLFLPNLFIALVILVVGAAIARFVGNMVEVSVSRMKGTNPQLLSMITRYAVLGFAVVAAVNQIGIANNLINILFAGLVASIALAFGLAFGLGGQSVASEMAKRWYEKSQSYRGGLKSIPGGGSSGSSSSSHTSTGTSTSTGTGNKP